VKTVRGIVRGKTIELPEETGLPEGQEVSLTLEPVSPKLPPGEDIRRSAGAWEEDAEELDKYWTGIGSSGKGTAGNLNHELLARHRHIFRPFQESRIKPPTNSPLIPDGVAQGCRAAAHPGDMRHPRCAGTRQTVNQAWSLLLRTAGTRGRCDPCRF
jgi:hypothetical protein